MTLLLFSLRYLFDGSMRPIAKFRGVSFIILPPTISWDRLYDALDDCSLMASPHIIHCKLSRSSSAFQFAYRLRLRAVPFGYVMARLWVADVKVECLLFYICPCVMRWLSSLTRPSRCDILYPPTPRVAYDSSAVAYPYVGHCITSGIICWRFKAPARLGTRDRRGRMMGRSHSLFISGCDILWGRAIVPQTKEDAITKAVFQIQALLVQGLPHDYSLIRLHLIPQSFYIYKARTHSLYCGHFWYGRYGLGCCPPYFFWGFAVIVWGFAVIVFSRHQVC